MATLQRTGITGSLNISGSGASGSIVLNITGSTGTLFIVDDVNSGSLFNVNNSIGLPVLEAFSDGTVNIGKYGSEGVKVYSNGNVSIANGALIVSSSGYVPTFPVGTNITSTDSVNRFYFSSGGDTRISSNGQFHVYSNGYQVAQFSNYSNGYFINTMYLGKNAGAGVNYARNSNFFGMEAGYGNYNANNVNAQGYKAGHCGSNNYSMNINYSNFFGRQAGFAGNYNAANHSNFMGYNAGYTSGNNNAHNSNFFGNQAGYMAGADNGASNSNFFGLNAGNGAYNAYYSNFFGLNAGYNAYYARHSNFLGNNAGYGATNANYSNFLGNSAGYGATNANSSNFHGYQAGNGATNANNSTFIGYQAGLSDTVNNSVGPKSSILIGDYTSTAGNSDSIAIGKGTANSANNQFNIGNVLFGLNIYSGSSSTSTAQTNGRVGIGKNNPVNTLDVVGNISASAITASTHYYTPSLSFISGSTTTLYITSSGNVGIGNTTFNSVAPEKLLVSGSTFNVISGYGNINNYIQLNIKNSNSGATGSSDIVATNNTGTETGNYVDLGINSSGHVPNGDIGQANDGYLYNTGSNFYIGNITPSKNLYFFAGSPTSTSSVTLTSTGNFGIGTTNPLGTLDVIAQSNSLSQSILVVPPQNNNAEAIYISGSNSRGGSSYIDFLAVTNTSASITNPNKYFRLNGSGDIEIVRSNYGLIILTLTNAGVLSTPGGGTSDARVKNNIEYIYDNALPTINQLKPAKFEFNSNLGVARHGFIAQDVLTVKPELVLGDGADSGGTYGLDYDGILALTVKALQEANTKIEQLEIRISQLENK